MVLSQSLGYLWFTPLVVLKVAYFHNYSVAIRVSSRWGKFQNRLVLKTKIQNIWRYLKDFLRYLENVLGYLDIFFFRRDSWTILRDICVKAYDNNKVYSSIKMTPTEGSTRGGGTLGISEWGCAAGTLEPLTYTRASSAEFCYPILE